MFVEVTRCRSQGCAGESASRRPAGCSRTRSSANGGWRGRRSLHGIPICEDKAAHPRPARGLAAVRPHDQRLPRLPPRPDRRLRPSGRCSLGLGTGEDFEQKIVVKPKAPERSALELSGASWAAEPAAVGTSTESYQKAEAKCHLTGDSLSCRLARRNRSRSLTKPTLVLRDPELLLGASQVRSVSVNLSVGALDDERGQEPPTSHDDASASGPRAGAGRHRGAPTSRGEP